MRTDPDPILRPELRLRKVNRGGSRRRQSLQLPFLRCSSGLRRPPPAFLVMCAANVRVKENVLE